MKYAKRLAVLAAVFAMFVAGGTPSDAATTATALEVTGTIQSGSNLGNGTGVNLGGSCAGTTVTASPSAGAGLCNLTAAGTGRGSCTLFTANVSGTLVTVLTVGASSNYSVRLAVTVAGGAVTLTGTATDGSGAVRNVTGSGVAVQNLSSGAGCGGPFTLQWAGAITIAG